METCEGVLLIPPERGQILGRAVWKPRYVVVGSRHIQREGVASPTLPQTNATARTNGAVTPKVPLKPIATDDYYISIFKSKVRLNTTEFSGQNLSHLNLQDDWEPSYQYPVSSVIDCQVQMLAHRKQGPVLPTLVVTINDKEKKRRSSRAAGLISSKESTATTLWFRTPPDDHHISLHEWARFIISRKLPMSPEESPASPSFTNPFSPQQQRPREMPDFFPRPSSGNPNSRSTLQHKNSSQTYSSRERPVTLGSDSPSLRSKRSDVSSPTSIHHPAHLGFPAPDPNKYTTVLPTDIPSPITTMSDYQQSEFIEGWTAAQGRSSTVSSPIRGRGSVSSGGPQPFPGADSSSPPGPRETILDRAFHLRCIPGSEREVPGEEKLTSLARFDALMREADERRHHQVNAAEAERAAMQSAFDVDEDSSEDEEGDDDDDDDDDEEDYREEEQDEYAHEAEVNGNRHTLIPPNAQRALEFLANRPDDLMSPRSPVMRSSPANFSVPLQAPVRPHTAHSRMRPSAMQRTYSQPQPMGQERLDVPTSSSGKISEDGDFRANGDKRMSSSSTKRLSFTEFTKRLSSTSSLLLVQTNTSIGSSCGSSELDPSPSQVPRGTLNARGVPPRPRDLERDDQDRRCGWRNSVGFSDGGLI
ncbi:uncharacterized protein CTRU02_201530 [Colletotrichum truncatum]|uniref:Uncharacterized protein n=1 Tax=Colletotrichum truncatum TaxID=5467 RepID=A0ACC3ZHM6_COLTU|nr:uncharacterized protein CTRU02_10757 [Colletotrichum truncatum]KAF6786633.1 hypothetical protein CTRU02_10757 [Colletotrichum truncatum]